MHTVLSMSPIELNYQVLPLRDQSGPGSDGNEGVLCISQSSNITGASTSDCLVFISRTIVGESLTQLQRCCHCILQSQSTGQRLQSKIPPSLLKVILVIKLSCTQWWDSSSVPQKNKELLLLRGLLGPEVILSVRVPYMAKITVW